MHENLKRKYIISLYSLPSPDAEAQTLCVALSCGCCECAEVNFCIDEAQQCFLRGRCNVITLFISSAKAANQPPNQLVCQPLSHPVKLGEREGREQECRRWRNRMGRKETREKNGGKGEGAV